MEEIKDILEKKTLLERESDFYNERQVAENQRIEKVRKSEANDDTTKKAQKQLRLFD